MHAMCDEDDDDNRSAYRWWRSIEESNQVSDLTIIDLSNLKNLTPRLKVLRELERLGSLAREGLEELRHKLLCYRSGDFWVPNGGIAKKNMKIPPIVTLVLVGFSGSGKSSLINLMYSVLGRSGLIPFARTSEKPSDYTTFFLEEHNVLRSVRSGFCVYDSRGLSYDRVGEGLGMVNRWMVDGIRHQQICEARTVGSTLCSSRYVKRRVNCVVVVASVAEIYKALMSGDSKPLEATRELFCSPSIRKCNENPILILTHGDQLSVEERLDGRVKICEFLGASETAGTYDIVCLTEHGLLAEELDPVTAYGLTEALYRALVFSDRTHCPKQYYLDWLIICLSWIMCSISRFLTYLASIFSALGGMDRRN
ncbi:hypothetical protein Scep_008931 [Stephania cephalantha]|uniref:Uncharacterized protein n=1 Tax=Stephania cephalantha TaxID=152367 RepID=A0AAP0JT41_9MAGN